MPAEGFRVSSWQGSAAAFHARPLPDPVGPEVWVFEVTRPALVLGSTQDPSDTVDHLAVEACAGVEVVRRRSGGGAVWLAPGQVVWVDVLVPAGHPRWDPDVGRATHWVGEAWAAALTEAGVEGVGVHRGGLVRSAWSATVCFAGLGPGEVTDRAGRKLVGISQRRTRSVARFQCALLATWDPMPYARYLAAHPPVGALADVAAGIGPLAERARCAFVDRLAG